jgi:hypothetical protein
VQKPPVREGDHDEEAEQICTKSAPQRQSTGACWYRQPNSIRRTRGAPKEAPDRDREEGPRQNHEECPAAAADGVRFRPRETGCRYCGSDDLARSFIKRRDALPAPVSNNATARRRAPSPESLIRPTPGNSSSSSARTWRRPPFRPAPVSSASRIGRLVSRWSTRSPAIWHQNATIKGPFSL